MYVFFVLFLLWLGHPVSQRTSRDFVDTANSDGRKGIIADLHKRHLPLLTQKGVCTPSNCLLTGKLADLMVMRTGEACQLFHNFHENPMAKKNPTQKRITHKILATKSARA